MRKVSKDQPAADMLPEYDFSKGVRATEPIHVWAPLIGFRWAGLERQIADDTRIRPASACRDYQKFAEFKYALAEEEWDRCREAEHWLALTHMRRDGSTKVKMNSFLLALWIVQPTQTHVPFRFETAEPGFRLVARVLDRFQWVEGHAEEEIKDRDLDEVTRILAPLRIAYATGGRLKNALALTFRGCVASDWQSAFICFSAAAEAILTYSQGPRLTDRLAESYAKLVSSSRSGHELTKDRFKRLYSIRSDIVHGRAYERKRSSGNLRGLGEFADVLRRLWKVVLKSEEVRVALEGVDKQRQNFFFKL
jgi:hypothetical protein